MGAPASLDLVRSPPDLPSHLRSLIVQVPAGRVTTFGALATALGDVTAARWVAEWIYTSSEAATLPAHRVVFRDGSVGRLDEPAGQQRLQRLLEERMPVHEGCVNLSSFGWDAFTGDRPLDALRHLQESLRNQVSLTPPASLPKTVGGVDLSYIDSGTAVGGISLVDAESGSPIWSTTVQSSVRFPYIPGYLTFRELPVHCAVLSAAAQTGHTPDVLLVDGSGILHKRRAGVATHLGVVTGLCTIGVTKSHLCGEIDRRALAVGESRPVLLEGEVAGLAFQPRATGKPIFVSPGHRCDVAFAGGVVKRLMKGRRLPEPLWWADRLSRDAVAAARS